MATSLRKGIKLYRKLSFEILLGMALVNSYLVFRLVSPRKIGLRQFKEELVEKMLNLSKPDNIPDHKDWNNTFLQKSKIKPQTQEDLLGVIRNLPNKKEEAWLLKKLGRGILFVRSSQRNLFSA